MTSPTSSGNSPKRRLSLTEAISSIGKTKSQSDFERHGSISLSVSKFHPEWAIGGRYKLSNPVCLRRSADLESEIVHDGLEIGERVLLLAKKDITRPNGMHAVRGLVLDSEARSGWMSFETATGERLLEKTPEPDSWEKGARYCIMFPSILRARCSLNSDFICELTPGDEVLVLDLGTAWRSEDGNPCLRAKVHNREGHIGWISCQSPDCKIRLLNPVDMFEVDERDLAKSNVANGLTPSSSSSGKFRSAITQEVTDWPWEVGGKYRVLADAVLRVDKDLNSNQVRTVALSEKVVVGELTSASRGSNAKPTPRAQVSCLSDGATGWISCEDKSGNCILDIRDCLEYEKVQRRLAVADKAVKEEEERRRELEEQKEKAKQEAIKREEARKADNGSGSETSTSARDGMMSSVDVEKARHEYGFDRFKPPDPEDENSDDEADSLEKDMQDLEKPAPKTQAMGPRKAGCVWDRCCSATTVQPDGKEGIQQVAKGRIA